MTGPRCPDQPGAVHAVSGLGLFFSVLASFGISAVSDGALCCCPVGGEEGGRVRAWFSAMGFLPFALITV